MRLYSLIVTVDDGLLNARWLKPQNVEIPSEAEKPILSLLNDSLYEWAYVAMQSDGGEDQRRYGLYYLNDAEPPQLVTVALYGFVNALNLKPLGNWSGSVHNEMGVNQLLLITIVET